MKTLFYWKFSCKIISYLIKITFSNPRICSKISSIKRRCVMKHTMKLGQSEPREIKNINLHIFNFRQYQSHWADVLILPVYLNLSHFMLTFSMRRYDVVYSARTANSCARRRRSQRVPGGLRYTNYSWGRRTLSGKLKLGKKNFIR